MKESGFGPKDFLSMVVRILPLKLGVRPSINAVGRRIVYVMFPSLAFSLRQASMLCLLMKWGTYVEFVSDFAPPRSTDVCMNIFTPLAIALSTTSFPCFVLRSCVAPSCRACCTEKTPQIGVPFIASRTALKQAVTSSRFPLTSLMVEDLAARAFAEGESGLRVSARIVKELFESEATMVSTNFFALLTCCTKDEEGLGLAMVGRISMQDCVVKVADRSCEER